jgi:hypothetical protein
LLSQDKTPSSRLSKLIPWSIMNRAKIDGRLRARRLPTSRPRRLSTFTERMSEDNTNRRSISFKGRISTMKSHSRRGDLKTDEGGLVKTRRRSLAGAEDASSSKDVSVGKGRRSSWCGEKRNRRSSKGLVTEQQTTGLKGLEPETFTSPQNSPKHFSSTRSPRNSMEERPRRHSFKEDDDNSAPG